MEKLEYRLRCKASIVNVLKNNLDSVAISPNEHAENILSLNLKGVLISNGPGDPRSLNSVISTVKELMEKFLFLALSRPPILDLHVVCKLGSWSRTSWF